MPLIAMEHIDETVRAYSPSASTREDHLQGKLFVDYLSPLKRQRIRQRLKKSSVAERKHQMPTPLRVVFAGTPAFAAGHLTELLASEHEVVASIRSPTDLLAGASS